MQALASSPAFIAIFLLAVLLAFHEIGYRLGYRTKGIDDGYKRRVETIRWA